MSGRRTKLVATLGPASDKPDVLRAMIDAGLDVARISLAHGSLDEAIDRYRRVRKVSDEAGRLVGTLIDLPGPKVRVATFPEGGISLAQGASVTLRAGDSASTAEVIEVEYDRLLDDIRPGDRLAFGDGNVVLEVIAIDGDAVRSTTLHGGQLSGRPGLHIPSDRLTVATPTPEDLVKLDAFVDEGIDMVAVSFVRSAHDVRRVGTEPHPRGPLVIAKIETRSAVENLAGIIEASDAIMVARGDLGTECSIEELPHLQKRIIRDCIAGGLPAITATQMLDSMVHSPVPTRAEASDVANAVFDGSSAIMLSAETAIGDHPELVIKTMARLAQRADEEFDDEAWARQLTELRVTGSDGSTSTVTDAMTLASWRASAELGVKTIICISGSGFTVRSMARHRPHAAILGFSTNERTVQQLTLSWGVTPMLLEGNGSYEDRVSTAVRQACAEGLIHPGELVAVLAGIDQRSKSTDVLRIVRV